MPLTDKWYGHSKAEWDEARAAVRALLLETARRRTVITYTEIARSVEILPKTGNALGKVVGQLLADVNEQESRRIGKTMMLSAVAVTVAFKPGPGFAGLAKQLGVDPNWSYWLPLVWKRYGGR